jgi:hypothetical protein
MVGWEGSHADQGKIPLAEAPHKAQIFRDYVFIIYQEFETARENFDCPRQRFINAQNVRLLCAYSDSD